MLLQQAAYQVLVKENASIRGVDSSRADASEGLLESEARRIRLHFVAKK